MAKLPEKKKGAGRGGRSGSVADAGDRRALLLRLFEVMSGRFGPCNWWPAESPFEVAVGAVLTQNTAWRNVDAALDRLRAQNALSPEAMWRMSLEDLEEALRPSGFFRLKAQRLRQLLKYFKTIPGWDATPGGRCLDFLRGRETDVLRRELLAVRGIGPETADCILLYALDRPSFVVDAYTRRIFSRHDLVDEDEPYETLRGFFMDALPLDLALFNEYHALIVRTGNLFCKKSNPRCAECPLGEFPHHAAL